MVMNFLEKAAEHAAFFFVPTEITGLLMEGNIIRRLLIMLYTIEYCCEDGIRFTTHAKACLCGNAPIVDRTSGAVCCAGCGRRVESRTNDFADAVYLWNKRKEEMGNSMALA